MFVAMLALASAGGAEPFPWPVSLGIAGISLAGFISLLSWVVKKIGTGEWVTRSTLEGRVEAERKRADDMIALHTALQTEQAATIAIERAGREEATESLRVALDSNRIVDAFFTEFLPKPPSRQAVTTTGGEA